MTNLTILTRRACVLLLLVGMLDCCEPGPSVLDAGTIADAGLTLGCGGFGGGSEHFAVLASPYSVDFGSVSVGATSAPVGVKVVAGGHVGVLNPLDITLVGSAPAAFSVDAGTCTAPEKSDSGLTAVQGGIPESCVATVLFVPTMAGMMEATLQIAAPGTGQGACIALSGTGL